MTKELKISLAQLQGDISPEKNLQKAESYIKKAAAQKSQLIVFPEMFMALPVGGVAPEGCPYPFDTGFPKKLSELAKKYTITVCAGVWEKSDDPQKVYNTAVVFRSDGKLIASYRKLHLFDALKVKESDLMLPGADYPPVFSYAGFAIGLGICYDLRFPEHFRYLSAQGAEIILLPAAWYSGSVKEEIWLGLLKARAIENVCFMGGITLAGKRFTGRSAAFDPFGVLLTDAGEQENLVSFTASKARLQEVREKLPALKHRRVDLFGK